MRLPKITRRDVLKGSAAVAAGTFASSAKVLAQAPAAVTITPELIKAAQKEGAVNYYTSIDLPLAERIARAFEAKYPGVKARVERSGAERVFQRIGQEYATKIHRVDVVNSSDAAHLIVWKNQGILAPFVPEDVAKHFPAEHKDPDGTFSSFRLTLCPVAYNTAQVKAEEAPKSLNDLLDPKWVGKITKAHPSYSGTILTATYQISRDVGWGFFEKLAKQKIMQLQSATDPPKKIVLGERMLAADGTEYVMLPGEGSRPPDRDRLSERRDAADRRAQCRVQGRAQSERGAPAAGLDVYAGMPAALHRPRWNALGACAREGKAGPHAARQDQADEGRRGRGRKAGRVDQEALQPVVWRLT